MGKARKIARRAWPLCFVPARTRLCLRGAAFLAGFFHKGYEAKGFAVGQATVGIIGYVFEFCL